MKQSRSAFASSSSRLSGSGVQTAVQLERRAVLGHGASRPVRARLGYSNRVAWALIPFSLFDRIGAVDEPRIAVLGPTGFTGRLVLAEARAAGMPLRLVGRRREALEELALAGDELRVADAAAPGDAFVGCAAVISCAGPFLRIGPAPVEAAAAAGAAYLDSSGEQAWARLLFERFRERGDSRPAVFRLRLRPGRRRGPARRRGARAARRDRGRLLGLRRRDEPRHPADGRRDHGSAGRRLARGPARGVPARRDDPDSGVPVRRPRGRRVRRRGAAHGAAPHRRPQRALVHAAREARGEGRAGGPVPGTR